MTLSRVITALTLALPMLAALSCGGGVGMADAGPAATPAWSPPVTVAPVTVPVVTRPAVVTFATATPFPTFTPEPTRQPAPLPSGVVVALPTAAPMPTPVPTAALPAGGTPAPMPTATPRILPTVDVQALDVGSFTATPTPAAYQLVIPDTDVKVARQTVFMSHYAEMPDFWPTPGNVFYTRTARFIGWRVELDYTDVGDDFEMTGLMRWLNVSTGEHVIYQEPYTVSKGVNPVFLMGQAVPGFWSPGRYRLELWDNRDRVAVYYDFEVRSGVTQ